MLAGNNPVDADGGGVPVGVSPDSLAANLALNADAAALPKIEPEKRSAGLQRLEKLTAEMLAYDRLLEPGNKGELDKRKEEGKLKVNVTSWDELPIAIALLQREELKVGGKSVVRLHLPTKNDAGEMIPEVSRMAMIEFLRGLQGKSVDVILQQLSRALDKHINPGLHGFTAAELMQSVYAKRLDHNDQRSAKIRELHDFRGTGAGSGKIIDENRPATHEDYIRNLTDAAGTGRQVCFRINLTQAEAIHDQTTRLLKAIETREKNGELSARIEKDAVRFLFYTAGKEMPEELTLSNLKDKIDDERRKAADAMGEKKGPTELEQLLAQDAVDEKAHEAEALRLKDAAEAKDSPRLAELRQQRAALANLNGQIEQAVAGLPKDGGDADLMRLEGELKDRKQAAAALVKEPIELTRLKEQREAAETLAGRVEALKGELPEDGGDADLRAHEEHHESRKQAAVDAVELPELVELERKRAALATLNGRIAEATADLPQDGGDADLQRLEDSYADLKRSAGDAVEEPKELSDLRRKREALARLNGELAQARGQLPTDGGDADLIALRERLRNLRQQAADGVTEHEDLTALREKRRKLEDLNTQLVEARGRLPQDGGDADLLTWQARFEEQKRAAEDGVTSADLTDLRARRDALAKLRTALSEASAQLPEDGGKEEFEALEREEAGKRQRAADALRRLEEERLQRRKRIDELKQAELQKAAKGLPTKGVSIDLEL